MSPSIFFVTTDVDIETYFFHVYTPT